MTRWKHTGKGRSLQKYKKFEFFVSMYKRWIITILIIKKKRGRLLEQTKSCYHQNGGKKEAKEH